MLHAIALNLATTSSTSTTKRSDCFHDAAVLQQAAAHPVQSTVSLSPNFNPGQLRDPAHPVAEVQVTIDAAGRLLEARIVSSTGNMWYDQGALQAARQSRYLPKTVNCEGEPGKVTLTVTFTPTPCDSDVSASNVVAPDYPDAARRVVEGAKAVVVQVGVSRNGEVRSVSILQSSGNGELDAAALRAALETTYRPAMQDCKPVFGTYTFRAEFRPN